jgi:hypothetical protein
MSSNELLHQINSAGGVAGGGVSVCSLSVGRGELPHLLQALARDRMITSIGGHIRITDRGRRAISPIRRR